MRLDAEERALVDRIAGSVRRGQGNRASAADRFVHALFANVPPQACADPDGLRGAAASLWKFARNRRRGRNKVRVFTPTARKDGWTVGHTVIEIVNDDMPFLVDSIIGELDRRNLDVHLLVHPVIPVARDASGNLVGVGTETSDSRFEAVMHIQITEQTDGADRRDLSSSLGRVLTDVRRAVRDWQTMRDRLADAVAELAPSFGETADLLRWLADDNFTFLGYREYAEGGSAPGAGLGLLRDNEATAFEGFGNGSDVLASLGQPLSIIKTDRRSTVHRNTVMDAVLVRTAPEGPTRLFAGLFTSSVYNQPLDAIPVIRRKIQAVVKRSRVSPNSHDGKALVHILHTLPRDEMFQIGERQLHKIATGILHLQRCRKVAMFVSRDPLGRHLSCFVCVPRERFDTRLRRRVSEVLEAGLDGTATAFYAQLSNDVHGRLHFVIKTRSPPSRKKIQSTEAAVIEACRDWSEDLAAALAERLGEGASGAVFERFRNAFPAAYRDRFPGAAAVRDIVATEVAIETGELGMDLYRPEGAPNRTIRFKVFHRDRALPLSDIIPMLENMGLRVIDEIPHRIRTERGETVWLHDFGMNSRWDLDLEAVKDAFERTFERVWRNEVENDGLNGLVISSGLDWRLVVVLRALTRYLRQTGIPFGETYMTETLVRNGGILRNLTALFESLFAPNYEGASPDALRGRIDSALDKVENPDEDRILRRFLNLVEATLRTNFYQTDDRGNPKPHLSFKFDSGRIADLPLPRPAREIFVYSPRMEGVHLRGGMVARGGIRWSDRREDFRAEILGLMKAQMTKNAVIIPVGAKGGFVVKKPPKDRGTLLEEGVACYRTLIRGLLDVTDNLKGGRVVPPNKVVRRDEDDPYLVVAADKGTATFSDIANRIAQEYGFWLHDAFASGGSAGYDHKKMGITARGAWVSVARHFRETGLDVRNENFTVVGVGDMSGDVFGNGMLQSKRIKLIGAFNHTHIFVDPDPDPEASWTERRRLFRRQRSSWPDYDSALISKSGGVFERSAKTIRTSARMRELFGVPEQVTPKQLVRALLTSRVDLLWFGGIGTFVKASDESHSEVGDRANDELRVDARELRCRVVGEGANMGFTQPGRIEYALQGGRINADFIDNSAGVGSSDQEVNIKILLGDALASGALDMRERDALLARMTDDVAEHVLIDNYRQSMALTHAEARAGETVGNAGRFIRALERAGKLSRAVEFLPEDEELEERLARGRGLTRPEYAVLLAYAKMTLYDDLLASDVPDDPWLVGDIGLYFPAALRKRFGVFLSRHKLRREICASYLANSLVNRTGPTFVNDLAEETGASPDRIAQAYLVARQVFDLRALWAEIEALDYAVDATVQTDLNLEIMDLIPRATTWFIAESPLDISAAIEAFRPGIAALSASLEEYLPDEARLGRRVAQLEERSVPAKLARRVAQLDALFAGCDIVRLAQRKGAAVEDTARSYYGIGARYGFDWLRSAAASASPENDWERTALSAVLDELRIRQTRLADLVVAAGNGIFEEADRKHAALQLEQALDEMRRSPPVDLAMLTTALRHIRRLCGE